MSSKGKVKWSKTARWHTSYCVNFIPSKLSDDYHSSKINLDLDNGLVEGIQLNI